MTIVDPTSRKALISAALVNMLADCAIVQSETGTTDRTTAKAFIVEGFGGREGAFRACDTTRIDPALLFFIVALGDLTSIPRARDTFGWEAQALIDINLPVVISDDPASMKRRAENLQDTVAGQLETKLGRILGENGSEYQSLSKLAINPRRIVLADDIDQNRLHLVATLVLDIGDLP